VVSREENPDFSLVCSNNTCVYRNTGSNLKKKKIVFLSIFYTARRHKN
jgi:hypothetical protein